MRKLWGRIRQLQYPKTYRISGTGISAVDFEDLSETIKNIGSIQTEKRKTEGLSEKLVCELCTNLWRLDRKLRDPETEAVPEELRLPGIHLQAVWDELGRAGYEVRHHTGERIPDKGILGLKKLAFETKDGLTHSIVLETMKPTIVHDGEVIQMGEVIVGIPIKDNQENIAL